MLGCRVAPSRLMHAPKHFHAARQHDLPLARRLYRQLELANFVIVPRVPLPGARLPQSAGSRPGQSKPPKPKNRLMLEAATAVGPRGRKPRKCHRLQAPNIQCLTATRGGSGLQDRQDLVMLDCAVRSRSLMPPSGM